MLQIESSLMYFSKRVFVFTMTISLGAAATSLRKFHDNVDCNLRREENICVNLPPLEPSPSNKGVPLCCSSRDGSSTSLRTRSRTPSPPKPSSPSRKSSLRNSCKVPRSISPGGTAAFSASDVTTRRGVRFCHRLVTAVHTRPRTPLDQKAKLFYSRADEIRFREEAAYACDDDWLDQLEEDSLPDENAYVPPPQEQQHTNYSISKAVVVFGSTTRTYGGGCSFEAAFKSERVSGFFFDDDAFWNGKLTWS